MLAATTGDTTPKKTCPFCANEINAAAIKCQFCHSMLDGDVATAMPSPATRTKPAAAVKAAKPKRPRRFNLLFYVVWLGGAVGITVAGYWGAAVVFLILAPPTWLLGELVQKLTRPTAIYARNPWDMLSEKFVWRYGPHVTLFLLMGVVCALGGFAIQKLAASPTTTPSAAQAASATPAPAEASSYAPAPPPVAPTAATTPPPQSAAQAASEVPPDATPSTPVAMDTPPGDQTTPSPKAAPTPDTSF